jgi:NAD(P)-dependent dehydrogenase (short-subunit alcohol dehydrogenase family)
MRLDAARYLRPSPLGQHDRVAIVTGANRGLGLEITRQLASLGATVVASGRDRRKVNAAARELVRAGLDVVPEQLDVTDPAGVERLVEAVGYEFGRVDILVNNAGVVPDFEASAASASFPTVQQALDTNLFGAWRLSCAVLPHMRAAGYGRIVNVSSGLGAPSGWRGGLPAYRVSKAALNALTRVLAAEVRGTGVLVNAACPGWVETEMGGATAPRSVEEGADTPVWLATLDDFGPTGGFFRDRLPIPW